MSEETKETGMSAIKKTVIGVITTAVTAAGAYVTTHIEAIFGGEEEEPKVEQVAPAKQESKQEVQVTGPTINLTIPEQKPAAPQVIRERVIEKAAPAPAPVQQPAKPAPAEEEDPW